MLNPVENWMSYDHRPKYMYSHDIWKTMGFHKPITNSVFLMIYILLSDQNKLEEHGINQVNVIKHNMNIAMRSKD